METGSGLGARGWSRALAVAPWLLLVACPMAMLPIHAAAPDFAQTWISISLVVFFAVILARLVQAVVSVRARRLPLVLLLVAVALFAAGSAVLNGSGQAGLTRFPAPGEWLFLASYIAMAGYLIFDTDRTARRGGITWLETAIVCGGTACLAGGLLVTAAANALSRDGVSVLLAVLYPLIDIILGLVVAGQALLGSRRGRESLPLLAGFALFAAADSTFLLHLGKGTYDIGSVSIVLWGCGFALIVGHASRVRSADAGAPTGRGLTVWVVMAGMAAAFVLAFAPSGAVRAYLLVPALATLAAAGARLVLAVRAANRVAEAIALARSDDLTGLPNRRAVVRRLDDALTTGESLGLMVLDLNGFKDINDTLGHGAGDAVLRQIAVHTRAAIEPDVMIARLGGDEFAVVTSCDDEIELMEIAQDVLGAVREKVTVDGIGLVVDASIGIAARQPHDRASSELLRRADVAMYSAKNQQLGVVVYDPDADDFSRERLRLADELRRAIAEDQLELWYQPQVAAATGHVCGLEALVRWRHPQHGLIGPAEFLPAARRAGLMQSLSEGVGRIMVADLVHWRQQGLTPRVALNCAPPELMSNIFLPRLCTQLAEADLDARRIVVEVTEDSFLAEPERARAILTELHECGFQLSIDDYGTGFSSLSYLRDLPVQELKLDRSFVSVMCADERSRMIIASTLQLATALGMRSVAEGVEDAATADALMTLGVDVLQGYHLARPMPPDEAGECLGKRYALTRFRAGLRIAGTAG